MHTQSRSCGDPLELELIASQSEPDIMVRCWIFIPAKQVEGESHARPEDAFLTMLALRTLVNIAHTYQPCTDIKARRNRFRRALNATRIHDTRTATLSPRRKTPAHAIIPDPPSLGMTLKRQPVSQYDLRSLYIVSDATHFIPAHSLVPLCPVHRFDYRSGTIDGIV